MTGGKIGNVDLVKQLNGAAVYRLIDQQGPISRIQVADVSRLAPASVTKITRQLLERGLIKEVAQQASTGGRRAISLTTECAPFHTLAVRLGRHFIELSLYDLSGISLAEHGETFHYHDQDELVKGLLHIVGKFLDTHQHALRELIAMSVVMPGLVDPDSGVVEYMPNINIQQLALAETLRNEFGVQAFVGNDIRGQALAEHYFGASQDYHDSMLVSVHHGTGAGIIVNGQIFLGHNRNVGELGHVQIDPLGKKCQCGNFGCLETVASNEAIIEHAQQLLAQGHPSNLSYDQSLTIEAICQAAEQGDELARQVLVKVGNHLGKAIAMTVNLFNPQLVVIAGKITAAKSVVFPAIERCVENQSLPSFHQKLSIVSANLESQPTMAAFALVKRAMLNGELLQELLEE
ncbi:ROK family protein [Salinivibrio sp. ES.052]|uniref:DNA-binding transcriptional regulator NagC n=1 Tax=Salinivibrio sp. ES.052 TaxID=1882823 RepID=UPI00092A605B|nr:ROK family protein [Salinivibrio sp. ES.052]SIN94612.1 N-acetylglucosamine repressor, NagC [Salinivibrio sp. ES.052]